VVIPDGRRGRPRLARRSSSCGFDVCSAIGRYGEYSSSGLGDQVARSAGILGDVLRA
jgi:hypothetical protein